MAGGFQRTTRKRKSGILFRCQLWRGKSSTPGVPQIGEYVFRSRLHATRPCKVEVDRSYASNATVTLSEPWVVEDMRRSATTHMRSLGVDRIVIDKILNHAEQGTTKVYDRWSADPEKATALERWSNRLREILAGDQESNVVQMAVPRP